MSAIDFGVLVNSPTCKFHLDQFQNNNIKEWAIYHDAPTYFLQFQHRNRAALLHWPFPNDPDFDQLVESIYDHCEVVVITITELHRTSMEFMRRFDREKIVFYVAGFVQEPLKLAQVKLYMDWFHTSRHFYRNYLPEILQRLECGVKENHFDILLGRKKLHRDFINQYVTKHLRAEHYFMTYFNEHEIDFAENELLWAWEQPGLRFANRPKWTVDMVEYFGLKMSISQVIPIDIYNRTAYSIVAETCYSNEFAFFTEKTAKPIIARRLFVMFAGQGYLARLRELGFQTFGQVIDESYDLEADPDRRWGMACDQLQWLIQQPQEEILKQIQPIVDHNFAVMMDSKWYSDFNSDLEYLFESILQQKHD
jgi:hypothetical protein